MVRARRFLFGLAAAIAACTTIDTNIGPQVARIDISPANPSLIVGDTLQLTAIATDPRGVQFIGAVVSWSSDNPGVASIDATGKVRTVVPGNATITVKAQENGASATTVVNVTTPPSFATSADSIGFAAIPNAPLPAAQAVLITNGGGGTLAPVVDSVVYGPGTPGWLTATLTAVTAPDSLRLATNTTALSPGTLTASIWLSAARATNSPHVVKVSYRLAAGSPTSLVIAAGDSQVAIAGAAVTVAPVVKVLDAYSNPVPGILVQFAVTQGGGSLGQAAATTGAAGTASPLSWTLGPSAGANHFTATVASLTPVTFTATAVPGNAKNLVYVSGDAQTDTVRAALGASYTVRVTDTNGNGVAGVTIGWAVPAGQGSITPIAPQTDANGFASATRTLGSTAGTQTATAAVGGLTGSPVNFTATANPGHASAIAVSTGNTQIATVDSAVAIAPTVLVTDAYGNPRSGVTVTYAAAANNGSVSGGSPATGGNGLAAVGSWTLGSVRRVDTLTATAAGLTGSPVTFTAQAAWSLARHVQPQVFAVKCAGCHKAGAQVPQLDTDSASYKNLLNGNGTATIYVTPFDTTDDGFTKTHGFLLFRLKSTSAPMPPVASTPLAVSDPLLYALVRDWILDGARR